MTRFGRRNVLGVPRLGFAARVARRAAWAPLAGAIALVVLMAASSGASAEESPGAGVTMTAQPMLAGHVRAGEWAAVRVRLENDGPAVDGELRISTAEEGASRYGIAVQLPPGARQDHILYGQGGFLGSRFSIALVSGGSVVASDQVPFDAAEPGALGVYIVAERPERLIGDVRDSVASRGGPSPVVAAIRPEDLPPRVEAWAAVNYLVWQDVAFGDLADEQLEALRTWVAVGGHLVIVGGPTGTAPFDSLPDELLPYRPEHVIDVAVADLESLLGTLPAGGTGTSLPALAGQLRGGSTLAVSGDNAIAARMALGQGSVSLIGIDPGTSWLAGSAAADALWGRAVPSTAPQSEPPDRDDAFLVDALANLPSVALPRVDHLVLLFAGYVLVLGPVNYVVLRRLDRREWAWLTMPVLIVAFTVAAFVLGVVLRGNNIVVNELAIVRGAAGTERGVADVYVGVFSPGRATFDIRLGGGALVSEPIVDQQDPGERPIDVLLGDPARLRGFSVGFGVLRAFRAEAAVTTPRVDADLQLAGDRIHGDVTNASGVALDDVSVVYGGGVEALGSMAPGGTRAIDLPAVAASGEPLAERLFGGSRPSDAQASRTLASRRAVIRHLTGGWEWHPELASGDALAASGPVILAWRSGGALDIDLGTAVDRVGETLYVLPTRAAASGPIAFSGGTLRHAVLEIDAAEAAEDPFAFYLSRGTMTVEYRPSAFEGSLDVTGLSVRLGWEPGAVGDAREDLVPLSPAEQPDQEDPAGSDVPDGPRADEDVPRLQLFDQAAGVWVEFERLEPSRTYRVVDPSRYVQASGSFVVRFVDRGQEVPSTFWLDARLEGIVE